MTIKKRYGVIAASVAAVMIGVGVGVAFWTVGGSGTGTAETGTVNDVTITQDAPFPSGLFPGGAAQDVNFRVVNANESDVFIGGVEVTVDSVTTTDDGDPATRACAVTDFQVNGSPVRIDAEVPGLGFTPSSGEATLELLNLPENQNECKNVTVTLGFTVVD